MLDGWWLEGHIEGVTGWSIGEAEAGGAPADSRGHAFSLFSKLKDAVIPVFCDHPDGFRRIMLHSIAFNGSFFNTHRMIQQYLVNAYLG